jgi:LDH2 family malate/lactate/ureidoglycolate dehydrogenase
MASDSPHPARYPSDDVHRYVAAVFAHFGLPAGDAALAATVLLDADLCGVDDHGIVNLARNPHYVGGLRSGHVNPRPDVTVLRDAPCAAAWDSGGGFGPLVAYRAMEAAIIKAEASGIGMITVRNGRHFGANGYFAEMAANRGHMAMVACNTPAVAFPPGGLRPVVGTNPLAFAAPVGDGPPLVVDIAMTTASGGKVLLARRAGQPVPEGWLLDAAGHATTDPTALGEGGSFDLLGGEAARHKGYGLALMVDALSMLAGGGSGLWQSTGGPTGDWVHGQWFAVWRLDLFIDPDEFAAEMRRVADHVRDVPSTTGERVLLPGQRRANCRADRIAHGIPLPQGTVERLEVLGSEVGAAFPDPL